MSSFSPAFYSGAFDAGASTPTVPLSSTSLQHLAGAVGRLAAQFQNQPNILAMLTALVAPVQPIEDALQQLLYQRALGTAIGSQLDAIGIIVGQPRNGYSDLDYARFLGARILVNTSDGVVEQLNAIAKAVVNNPAATIRVKPQGTATVVVVIGAVAVSVSTATIASMLLIAAAATGVRLVVEASTVVPGSTFTLDIGPGFDHGVLAYAI